MNVRENELVFLQAAKNDVVQEELPTQRCVWREESPTVVENQQQVAWLQAT